MAILVAILEGYIGQSPYQNLSKRLIKVMHIRNLKAFRCQRECSQDKGPNKNSSPIGLLCIHV